MKLKNIILFGFVLFAISCKNSKTAPETTEDGFEDMDEIVNVKKEKKITTRDYSITADNAYNNAFLDSLAMERYIQKRQIEDKKIARRIRSFYNARNFQYAWFSPDGITEQTRFFWNQYDYAVTHQKDSTLINKEFFKKAEALINQENPVFRQNDSSQLQLEFAFTEHFIRYINSVYEEGYVKRKEQEKFVPIKKMDPIIMADSLLTKKHKDDRYYEQVNDLYAALKNHLQLYHDLAKAGGWPEITFTKGTMKPGQSNDLIPVIKNRLFLTQDLPVMDTSKLFTDTLELAVRKFQRRHGYTETGTITPQLVKEMNVPAVQRLMQVLLNMDRMRWLPQKPSGHLIIVNIPEFILRVYDGKKELFNMAVVVGKVGNNTMMFNGDLNQVIFSPYWNVPQSIINSEIEPAIARNPNYLENKNMERTSYGIRQRPGPGNALGKVKFIFPNSFNMYFHDTPSKSLFDRDKRAFSHGCIRLSEPQKMAEWLLRDDPNWPTDKIVEAMNAGKERAVKIKNPVPVFIIYYTSWVDDRGELNFREDVYSHDKSLIQKMFTGVSADVVTVK